MTAARGAVHADNVRPAWPVTVTTDDRSTERLGRWWVVRFGEPAFHFGPQRKDRLPCRNAPLCVTEVLVQLAVRSVECSEQFTVS